MPLRDIYCKECKEYAELLVKNSDELMCPFCESKNVTTILSAPAGYYINGNNSASVRPKSAFKKVSS